jgi:hypothetical protein
MNLKSFRHYGQLSCIKAGFTTWRAGLRDYSYGCNHNTFQSKVASLSDHSSVLGCLLSGRLGRN